jgi:hypothetical protein
MAEHKFKIGQLVYLNPTSRLAAGAPSGPYQITRRLPETDRQFQYAIKSAFEDHERVVLESDLTRAL